MRIVLDSNVYISALLFGGIPELPIRLAIAGKITVLISEAILSEVKGVLSAKFRWTDKQVAGFEKEIRSLAEVIDATSVLSVVTGDAADNRVLECAVDGSANCIITGDRHLARLKTYGSIRIVSPRQFAEALGIT
jgi:putative PIN family toxin of toxin-antitoxin system